MGRILGSIGLRRFEIMSEQQGDAPSNARPEILCSSLRDIDTMSKAFTGGSSTSDRCGGHSPYIIRDYLLHFVQA